MSDPHTWQGIVGWTLLYTAVAWTIIFTVRLLIVAPFQLFREQKKRADELEGLRQVANDASRPPSFDIGFEYTAFDSEKQKDSFSFHTHFRSLRIWVENIEGRPIEDCRVVVESFGPNSPIRNGAMLLPDNRGSDEEKSARFDLVTTEKRFLKFIDLDVFAGRDPDNRHERYGHTVPGHPPEYLFGLRSDQEGTGADFLSRARLDAGKQYFVTIVVHGKNANSRRMDMTIDVMDDGNLRVVEAASSASYRKEILYEKQG